MRNTTALFVGWTLTFLIIRDVETLPYWLWVLIPWIGGAILAMEETKDE